MVDLVHLGEGAASFGALLEYIDDQLFLFVGTFCQIGEQRFLGRSGEFGSFFGRQSLFPGLLCFGEDVGLLFKLLLQFGNPLANLFSICDPARLNLPVIRDFNSRFITVVQECEKLVILTLGQWVEFVVMATGAPHCKAEKDRAGGRNTVCHSIHAELFVVGAALFINQGIAMKTRGDQLVQSGVLQ